MVIDYLFGFTVVSIVLIIDYYARGKKRNKKPE